MGKLYRLQCKLYLKTIYLPAVYLLLLGYGGYLFYTFYSTLPAGGPLMSFQSGLTSTLAQFGTLCFTLFLFEAYEFLHKAADRGLRESLRGICNGERRTFFSQLLVLLSLVALTFLLAIPAVLFISQHIHPMPAAALFNALLALMLYLLCPMLIAVLLGAVGALRIGRLPFYVLALLFVFLFSEFSEAFVVAASFQAGGIFGIPIGLTLLKLTGLFRSLTLSQTVFSDNAYGLSVEPFRWALALFWLCLCLALILWLLRRRKGLFLRIASGVLAAVCVVSLWSYANPGSNWRVPMVTHLDNVIESDSYYYNTQNNAQYNETKPAAFSVTDCILDLSLWKELSATATLTLDGTKLPEYDFTLYHAYTVRSVSDGNGNPLPFKRWHDYLSVQAPDGAALTSVRIVYDGYHPSYYSSAQGAFLPGFFPYYPMEGLYPVLEAGQVDCTLPPLPTERNFTVHVSAPCDAFSNLSLKDGQTLTGRAKSLTVTAGMYEEKAVGGDHVVAPYGTDVFEIGKTLDERMAYLEEVTGVSFDFPELKKVIYAPNLFLPMPSGERPVFFDDYLLYYRNPYMVSAYDAIVMEAAQNGLPESAGKEKIRLACIDMIQSVLLLDETAVSSFAGIFGSHTDGDYKVIPDFSDEENALREVKYYIYKALIGSDAKTIFHAVDTYLKDSSDTTDELTFAKALAERYPIKEAVQQ